MKSLIIIDIKSNNFKELDDLFTKIYNTNTVILALSPSSFYYLDYKNKKYLTFHDLITIEDFRNKILHFYDNLLKLTYIDSQYRIVFRNIVQSVNYLLYIDSIVSYFKDNNFSNIKYITDKESDINISVNNNKSLLYKYLNVNNIFTINEIDNRVLIKRNIYKEFSFIILIKKIKNKLLNKILNYDWIYINPHINKVVFSIDACSIIFNTDIINFTSIENQNLIFSIEKEKFTFIDYTLFMNQKQQIMVSKYKQLGNKLYFYQHGSYFYHYYTKSSCRFNLELYEIDSADINFVFNDYTKKLFEDLNAKKVYSVGSILFNKPIKEKKKEYDYLYVTQGHDYMGNLQYVDFPNSLHSFDGYELYQRHKNIIELFGTKFKDKKILIRVHPCVVTTGVYVPFWELSEQYPNITIDVSIPIHTLIEKSKYIISDYFTTEFINRELHYKRDIILFEGAPTPLPEETLEDMDKMFILVDTVEDLEIKVLNIEKITKNRKRYDDIIEYYSSKKCDTKKVVTEILEKELNARR